MKTQAINKLAALTAGNDLTGDFEHDEQVRRDESLPAPQQAMSANATAPAPPLNADQNYRQLVQANGEAPLLPDEVTASLLFAGMTATWAVGFWMVQFKDKRSVTKRIGGRVVTRSQTGVAPHATLAEWHREINALAQSAVFGNDTER